jgi:transposase-like protein
MFRKSDPEPVVREIRRKTRRRYSTEEKTRIVPRRAQGRAHSPSTVCAATTARWAQQVHLTLVSPWAAAFPVGMAGRPSVGKPEPVPTACVHSVGLARLVTGGRGHV